MKKATLRTIYKEKRKGLSAREIAIFSDLLLINFQKLDLPFINCVHTYLAAEDEVDTWQIIRYLSFRHPGIQICIPRINAESCEIENFIYREDMEIKTNKYGIEEPVNGEKVDAMAIDLILTPLLAFDKKGQRVGYGKGYYDKFLFQCKIDVIKIGLSFFEPVEMIEDTNQFDIPLNFCVTPQKIYSF